MFNNFVCLNISRLTNNSNSSINKARTTPTLKYDWWGDHDHHCFGRLVFPPTVALASRLTSSVGPIGVHRDSAGKTTSAPYRPATLPPEFPGTVRERPLAPPGRYITIGLTAESICFDDRLGLGLLEVCIWEANLLSKVIFCCCMYYLEECCVHVCIITYKDNVTVSSKTSLTKKLIQFQIYIFY